MAARKKAPTGVKNQKKLMTLSEVSRRTKISMPTLLRYKKEYQDRIPSEGEGRTQRYPTESLKVFRAIKKENLKKRGRPPKSAAPPTAAKAPKAKAKRTRKSSAKKSSSPRAKKKVKTKAKAQVATESGSLLSLLQISKLTGIEYTKLQRLTKKYLEEIPTEGVGRTKKYYAEAVDIYKRLEAEGASRVRTATTSVKRATRRARRKVKRVTRAQVKAVGFDEAGLQKKVVALEEVNASLRKDMVALQRDMKNLVKNLKKSIRITVLK